MALIPTCPPGNEGQTQVGLSTAYHVTCVGGWTWVEEQTYTPWWAYEIPIEQVNSLISELILWSAVVFVCASISKALRGKK